MSAFLDRIALAMPDVEMNDREAYEVLLAALLILPDTWRDKVAAEVERIIRESH